MYEQTNGEIYIQFIEINYDVISCNIEQCTQDSLFFHARKKFSSTTRQVYNDDYFVLR